MTAPLFLADGADLGGPRVVLTGAEGHHAARVRRLVPGEQVDVTDGAGLVVHCVVALVDADTVALDAVARRTVPAPAPRLVAVQALPKGDRGELAVEMLTEVGVDEIVPWTAARCVTQWRGDRGARALDKWRSRAREAAKQARRPWLPTVTPLAGTPTIAERVAAASLAVVLHESATEPLARAAVPSSGEVVLVVGPEGGLADEEVATLVAAGARACRLGDSVLRTSTAGVVAAALVLARAGRWG